MDGSPYPEPLWFFHVRGEIESIDPQLGGVRQQIVSTDGMYQWKVIAADKLAVYKDTIAGRAAWYDVHYPMYPFFSDALVERMKAKKMEGWDTKDTWREI